MRYENSDIGEIIDDAVFGKALDMETMIPSIAVPEKSLAEASRRRNAVRVFAKNEIEDDKIQEVLDRAVDAGYRLWGEKQDRLYLMPVTPQHAKLYAEFCEIYTTAPLFIMAVIDELSLADPGKYRTALLGAGSGLYLSWLSAIESGLEGCMFGAASNLANNELSPTKRHIATLSLGYRLVK